MPPPDWLAVLRAYVMTYPEVGLFQGSCRPQIVRNAPFIVRLGHDLGFFPRGFDNRGLLYFAHATAWACNKSLLLESGGVIGDEGGMLGVLTLTERVMKAGASSLYASDWQTRFQLDSTPKRLLQRFYLDGYFGAKHIVATNDHELAARLFSTAGLHGSISAAWRFAMENFKIWRFANPSYALHAPNFLLLLAVGFARQFGWRAGLTRNRN
jgi:hypothetical protein